MQEPLIIKKILTITIGILHFVQEPLMIFQKRPRCKENKHTFRAGQQVLQHTHEYTYLGLKISSTGSFNLAVNALKAKALRVFYMIKIQFGTKFQFEPG